MLRKFKLSKTNSISIIETNWSEHSDDITRIRDRVFIQEQAVPRHIEVDGKDSECIHFLIFNESVPIGTARIKKDGKIERVSILKNHRRKGLGYQLMKFIINNAQEKGLERIYLHSQMDSIEFYKSLKFIQKGEAFKEAGIDHVLMVLEDE